MRGSVVEAVMRRMPGVFAIQVAGKLRPDVVISRREVKTKGSVRCQDLLYLLPFGVRGGIVETLNRVACSNHEGGVGRSCFRPDLLIYVALGFARAIAQNDEVKSVRRRSAPPVKIPQRPEIQQAG